VTGTGSSAWSPSAALSDWPRDLAPSTELRRWFGHDPARWDEFRRRYWDELAGGGGLEVLRELRDRSRREATTLVFGARDREHNNAAALLEFVDRLSREMAPSRLRGTRSRR
jgi:uncharacterized protein YeaO (DUF488 family)